MRTASVEDKELADARASSVLFPFAGLHASLQPSRLDIILQLAGETGCAIQYPSNSPLPCCVTYTKLQRIKPLAAKRPDQKLLGVSLKRTFESKAGGTIAFLFVTANRAAKTQLGGHFAEWKLPREGASTDPSRPPAAAVDHSASSAPGCKSTDDLYRRRATLSIRADAQPQSRFNHRRYFL